MNVDSIKKHNQDPYSLEYEATVINNDDPDMLGRIKVNIPKLTGNGSIWVRPENINSGVKFFYVPIVNSIVKVKFTDKNIYSGVWFGSSNKLESLSEYSESGDYPNVWGWVDENDNRVLINKVENSITIKGTMTVNLIAITDINMTAPTINMNATSINMSAASAINMTTPLVEVTAVDTNFSGNTTTEGFVLATAGANISGGVTIDDREFLPHQHGTSYGPTTGVI